MIRNFSLFLLIAAGSLFLTSCSDTSSTTQNSSDQVSSIPWNRPEKWENGSMMPGGSMGTR